MVRRQFQTSMTSRERNRIHARKTRQRKKEQLQILQTKAEELKGEQTNLKLSINEKNTANILCCLFSNAQGGSSSSSQNNCGGGGGGGVEDPRVEVLLQRPEEEIPDPSKLSALQPLILPSGAQHSKKCNKNQNNEQQQQQQQQQQQDQQEQHEQQEHEQELPDDGIDYELLGKDRSKCTPAELDQIRRERNRMHAKRTRDRKRIFMEEMADMCKVLEEENQVLQQHLDELNGVPTTASTTNTQTQIQQQNTPTVAMVSPSLSPTTAPTERSHNQKFPQHQSSSSPSASFDQMKTLLDAAGVFDLSFDINSDDINNINNNNNGNNSSCAVSISSEDHREESSRPLKKRRKFHPLTSSTLSDTEDGSSD
jgi:hypothetical protein